MVSPRSSLIVSDEGLSSETGNGTDFVVLLSGEPQGQPHDPAAPSADRGALRTPARPPAMVALALGGPVLHLVTRRLAATGDDLRSAAVGWARPSSIGSQRLEKLVGREQPSRVFLEQQVRLRELSTVEPPHEDRRLPSLAPHTPAPGRGCSQVPTSYPPTKLHARRNLALHEIHPSIRQTLRQRIPSRSVAPLPQVPRQRVGVDGGAPPRLPLPAPSMMCRNALDAFGDQLAGRRRLMSPSASMPTIRLFLLITGKRRTFSSSMCRTALARSSSSRQQ